MPATLEYTCRRCAFKVDANVKSFWLGPQNSPPDEPGAYKEWEKAELRWLEANTRAYVCNPCWLSLTIPLVVVPASWDEWKRSNIKGSHPYTEYPFLISLASRIDQYLNEMPGSPIDLGSVACPYCTAGLLIAQNFSPRCPQCGVEDMEATSGGIANMRFGVVWPPIA